VLDRALPPRNRWFESCSLQRGVYRRRVAEAMDQGAIGMGALYSLNHSGWGGVRMPSTISDISEFDALVGAMGGRPWARPAATRLFI